MAHNFVNNQSFQNLEVVLYSVGNQQPLTRHAANEGCAEGFH
jgi:hypothetical protein